MKGVGNKLRFFETGNEGNQLT